MAQELGRMPDWMIQSLGGKEFVLPQLEEADQAQLKAKTKMPLGMADALAGQERIDSAVAGFNNQRNQGGVGATNGSTVGAAVNSGTGTQEITKPTLGNLTNATTQADLRGKTTYTSQFDPSVTNAPNATVTRLDGSLHRLSGVNAERDARSPGGGTIVGNELGGNSFNESNTNPRSSGGGAFSTYTQPDYKASIAALKDLREAKIEAAGGGGNRGKGMQDYEKDQSYSQDLADYNSGQVGSEGYNKIRNERMNMESMIDDIPRGVARGPIIEAILNNYGESQKARLGLDAKSMENQTDMNIATMEGMSENAKLALAQQKELFGQYDADRKFGLEQGRFGLDTDKANADRSYKFGQLGIDEAKLGQSQAELGLKASDYASQAEKRKADVMLGQIEGLRKAFETGQEPIKNATNIMKQEGGMATMPAAARVQLLISLGLDPSLIDPEGYVEYMKSQQAGQ